MPTTGRNVEDGRRRKQEARKQWPNRRQFRLRCCRGHEVSYLKPPELKSTLLNLSDYVLFFPEPASLFCGVRLLDQRTLASSETHLFFLIQSFQTNNYRSAGAVSSV